MMYEYQPHKTAFVHTIPVTESYGTDETYPSTIIKIEFDSADLSVQDHFRMWKNFMSAMGYSMDNFELEHRHEEINESDT